MHRFSEFRSLTAVINYLSHLSYWQIWLAILASGHVIPIPEGVTFAILGFLAASGKGSLAGFILISIIGAASYDAIVYAIARGGTALAEKVSEKSAAKYLKHYRGAGKRRLLAMVVASHFVPGWRFLNPIILAVIDVPVTRFVLYTLVACAVYAPVYVLIGYIFHHSILALITAILSLHRAGLYLSVGVIVLLALVYLGFEKRR